MKLKCEDCNKETDGIPKKYNKFEADLCYICFSNRIERKRNLIIGKAIIEHIDGFLDAQIKSMDSVTKSTMKFLPKRSKR